MGCLPQLEYISCSYNHICSIDPSIGKLRHLRELKLASNKFKLFPEELFPLRGLQLIDLSKNHISHIPSGIGRMKVRIVELYKTRLLTKNPTLIKISVSVWHYRLRLRTFCFTGCWFELERQLHLHNIKWHFDDAQFANIATSEQQIDAQRNPGESFWRFPGKCGIPFP